MNKNSNAFTLGFAVVVCVVMAILLAATFNGLKDTVEANAIFDKQRNVLLATGLAEKGKVYPRQELERMFAERIRGKVLEVERVKVKEEVKRGGDVVEQEVERIVDLVETDLKIADLAQIERDQSRKPKAERKEYATIYQAVDDKGATLAWCIPISGYGLWSTLYGFLALKDDLRTVQGITFYKHGETPGLGGEVDNIAWQESWEGKKTLDDAGHLVSVSVKKGVVDPAVPNEREHMVDGLSGATITSNGVTRFVHADLEKYEPYFKKLRH